MDVTFELIMTGEMSQEKKKNFLQYLIWKYIFSEHPIWGIDRQNMFF